MKREVYLMLINQFRADRAKALLTLKLLGENPVGIGDHTSEDLQKDLIEAVERLDSADSNIETLEKYFKDSQKETL